MKKYKLPELVYKHILEQDKKSLLWNLTGSMTSQMKFWLQNPENQITFAKAYIDGIENCEIDKDYYCVEYLEKGSTLYLSEIHFDIIKGFEYYGNESKKAVRGEIRSKDFEFLSKIAALLPDGKVVSVY